MFETEKLTDKIFKLDFPYNNPYQGMHQKLLFCCSVGLLRSPTAAVIATEYGYNTRSCGTSSKALIPLSANLIVWADKIVFINQENYDKAIKTFNLDVHEAYLDYQYELEQKSIIWNIEDDYEYMHPDLVLEIHRHLRAMQPAPHGLNNAI